MLHDATVVKNYIEGKAWGVFIPCDTRKEATGTAQFINFMIREGEKENQKAAKLTVLPPAQEAAEPSHSRNGGVPETDS